MTFLSELQAIPIVNDHTHIFGTGEVMDYEQPGRYVADLTPQSLVAGLSNLNMNETSTMNLLDDPERLQNRWLELYRGRRTTFPARAMTRFFRQEFALEEDEITLENAAALIERMRSQVPVGTTAFYEYLGRLSNTEIWFCNHGNVARFDSYAPQTTRGLFRWVPYCFNDAATLNATADKLGLDRPRTEDAVRQVMLAALRKVKELGAVAVKGGAFAYSLDRPFAPDVNSLRELPAAKERIDRGQGSKADSIVVADALAVIASQAAGVVGLPMQIHVGLIWSASGPTRIPEIMELTPLFDACRETTFVIFHGAYPRTDDLAHVAATVSNVRAEFNWVPFWAGLDFVRLIGKWIDMIPADRLLYGTDSGGFSAVVHDMITRAALAEALGLRIQQGYLSSRTALEVAANILRNNSIETYCLGLPLYRA